jgi:tRNA G18 (ribose-2'-O)-methylase SpoU
MKNPTIQYSDIIAENMKNTFNVRDDVKNLSVPDIKVIHDADRLPFDVCLFNVEGDLNLGVAIRSASLLGARRVFVFGRRKFDHRSLVGSDKYIDVIKVDGLMEDGVTVDLEAFAKMLSTYNLFPWLIEQGGNNVQDIDWKYVHGIGKQHLLNLCIVFGNESNGLPKELLTYGFPLVSIPQYGVMRSFNVSAAASIVMWEVSKALSHP